MTNKTRNYKGRIASLLAAGAMLLPGAGYAQNPSGSVELFSDGKTTTTDTKILVPSVAPSDNLLKRMGLFLRNRNTIDNRVQGNPVSSFSLADVTYNVKGGFDAVYETQLLPNGMVVPMAGGQYFTKIGKDTTFYGIGAVTLNDKKELPRYAEITGKITYTPKLTENLNLVSQLEALNNFSGKGMNFAVQRARLGVQHKNGWAGGVGADIKEIPSQTGDLAIDKIVGIWARKSF